jgi:hypothetical protein
MVSSDLATLKPGKAVYVQWGLERRVRGRIVEVWGDPPAHIRVQLELEGEDAADEPVILLLSPSVVQAA